ncbi:MAG: flagellar basal-body rod protein FlgF [Firmicutes bacterium]|nr:flagellar basal-body rod protein FlgF [Bacillota bacterium]
MIRGLYASAMGMLALMNKQDVISNNLANINTTGFKKDYISITSFPEALVYAQERRGDANYTQKSVGLLSSGVGIGGTGFIISNGALRQTGGTFDLALTGEGFFTVLTPSGERYTRDGSFTKDGFDRLVDQEGNLVLGENGAITITGSEVHVDEVGRVYVDGAYTDTLKIRNFSKGELEKVGSNTFKAFASGQRPTGFVIRQGYLEGSNVNATDEMVDMIATIRSYEANQRVLKAQDELLGRAVNEVGRVG